MWQPPNQKARAQQAQKRRERARPKLQLKRVGAEIRIGGGLGKKAEIVRCRLFLNDIQPHQISFFSGHPLLVGTELSITIEAPKSFYVKGRLVVCAEYNRDSQVISEHAHRYRNTVELEFENEEQAAEVKSLCQSLASDHLYSRPKAA
jgi:hypothetical protein